MQMYRQSWSKRAIASVSAMALLTATLAPLAVGRVAGAAEAGPPISAGAAKPATKPPATAATANPQGDSGEKSDTLTGKIKKQAASVGMLLLLLAAAPGNLARNVDQAIQRADFGRAKSADGKTSEERGGSSQPAGKVAATGALPGPR